MRILKWGLVTAAILLAASLFVSRFAQKQQTFYYSCNVPFEDGGSIVAVFEPGKQHGTLKLAVGEAHMFLDTFEPDVIEGNWESKKSGKPYRFWMNRLSGDFQIMQDKDVTASGTCTIRNPQ